MATGDITSGPKLGQDFNASRPVDSEYVRHPSLPQLASTIRDLRSRFIAFFATTMARESGDFQDNIIPSSSLIDQPTKPSSGDQFYQSVTIDKKGIVLKGSTDPVINAARPYRALYTSSGGWYEDTDQLHTLASPGISDWPVASIPAGTGGTETGLLQQGYQYSFLVKDGVSKLKVLIVSGDGTDQVGTIKPPPALAWGELRVNPNEYLTVFVGSNTSHSFVSNMGVSWYVLSTGYVKVGSSTSFGAAGLITSRQKTTMYRGTAAPTQNPGMVYFEWYV